MFLDDKGVSAAAANARLEGNLEVTFIQLAEDTYGKYALFEVTNGGSETAYYYGYGKTSHCSELVRQGFQIDLSDHCWCGTGLEEQSLKPGESEIFRVRIRNPNYVFEVGFDFSFGEQRQRKTIWSRTIEPWSVSSVEK
jgi:hypothetical protein